MITVDAANTTARPEVLTDSMAASLGVVARVDGLADTG